LAVTQGGYYEVATGERAVYVRVHGIATMSNCLCLRTFIEELLAGGRSFIIVDLADCEGMDSTFMGVLAEAATYDQNGKTPGIAAVNVSEPLLRLLKNVGLTELIFVESEPFEAPRLEFVRLDEQRGEKERLACVHAAHEHLMKLNDRNEEIFRPFVAALEREMKQRGMKEEN
jgi:anti-anti-sigma regulatory factor